jgi:hypothetical protein
VNGSIQLSSSSPQVITLCGSMKYRDKMLTVAGDLTLKGCIVLMPFSVADESGDSGKELKLRLDVLHFRKIDLSEGILVVTDSSGYWGDSTSREIAYAESHQKYVGRAMVYADSNVDYDLSWAR